MAKKIVRGITDIKTISNQDLDTNNVNDLLSDGEHSYIHRKKKDGSEEYHNLTNNLKTIEAEDNGLLTVRNYNNSTNSAKLTVHHDPQKEQKIYSTDHTIEIVHGDNGTGELTNVDVNPEKVLEHDNLISNSDYVTIEHEDDSDTTVIKTDKLDSELEIVGLRNYVLASATSQSLVDGAEGRIYDLSSAYGDVPIDAPLIIEFDWSVTEPTETSKFRINRVIHYTDGTPDHWNSTIILNGESTDVSTSSGSGHYCGTYINIEDRKTNVGSRYLYLNQTVTSGTVTISNLSIRRGYLKAEWIPAPEDSQLYTNAQTYTHTNGIFKTYVKSVANSASVDSLEEEFNFLAKMNKSQTNAEFTLNEHDTAVFQYLVDTYGVNNVINVSGSAFTLNGSQLTFGSNGSTYNPHIITFTDIIPTSTINTRQSAPSRGDSVTVDKLDKTVETEKETE